MKQELINVFQNYRMAPTAIDKFETEGKQKLMDRFEADINKEKPLRFAMLGFPFKSSNLRDKVLSPYPDLAEKLTIKNFSTFNHDVQSIYSRGVDISVVSDGFVFNDLLNIPDAVVHEYQAINADMARQNTAPVQFYSLNDFYSSTNLAANREKLMQQFGITAQELEQKILFDPDVNFLYRGMIIFMSEELANKPYPSNSQRQKAAKKLVREMMLRNEAYSNLVKHIFPEHTRLSMHKSVNDGNKYSFQLIRSPFAVYSAWHCAIAMEGDTIKTMHKIDAVNQGFELVYEENQPYYFVK